MKKGIKVLILCFAAMLAVIISACGKVEPIELSTPVLTKVNDSTISWEAVEHAVAYDVEVNNVVSRQTTTEYQVSTSGTYVIKVKAIAELDSDYKDSVWSDGLTLVYVELPKLSAPVIEKTSYASIKWTKVEGAKGYRVYVNGEAQTPDLAANTTAFNILYLGFGIHKLQVQALPSDTTQFNPSNLSNEISLELIDPLTFEDRLSLTVSGSEQIEVGKSVTYTITINDKHNADTSFLVKESTWKIIEGEDFATVDNMGKVTALEPGEVVIRVVHKVYPFLFDEITIVIVEAEE